MVRPEIDKLMNSGGLKVIECPRIKPTDGTVCEVCGGHDELAVDRMIVFLGWVMTRHYDTDGDLTHTKELPVDILGQLEADTGVTFFDLEEIISCYEAVFGR